MNRERALQIITGLADEVQATGNPEGVLLKYANDHNLPPAQLEFLGQLFNTAMSVGHMRKNANARGANHKVVDVPGLLESYNTYTPPKVRPIPTANEDVLDWFKGASAKSRHVLPDYSGGNHEDAEDRRGRLSAYLDGLARKSAAEADEEAPIEKAGFTTHREQERDREHARLFRDKLTDVMWAQLDEARQDLGKVANQVELHGPESFAMIEWDLASTEGRDAAVAFMNKVASHCDSNRIQYKRCDFEGWEPPRMGRDRFSVLPIMKEASEKFANAKAADEMLKAGGSLTMDPPTKTKTDTAGKGRATGGPFVPEQRSSIGEAVELVGDLGRAVDTGGEKIRGSVTSPADYMASTGKRVRDLAELVGPEKHEAQKKVDKRLAMTRAQINLQRMLVSDPVISEADPEDVADIYASIWQSNPEATQNYHTLRMLLREAISLDAIPVETSKQLADIRKTTEQARSLEKDRTKARHDVKYQKSKGGEKKQREMS